MAMALTACRGPDGASVGVGDVVTTARVQSVTALGTYLAAKRMAGEDRDTLERCLTGLQTLRDAGQADLVSISVALQAAGVDWLETPEGTLAIGAVVAFEDLWSGSGKKILDSSYGVAVRDGAIQGLQLALARKDTAKTLASTDPVADQLADNAKRTRR